jgi:hypothetical protein
MLVTTMQLNYIHKNQSASVGILIIYVLNQCTEYGTNQTLVN